jgi:hypothetical protein
MYLKSVFHKWFFSWVHPIWSSFGAIPIRKKKQVNFWDEATPLFLEETRNG